MPKAPQKAPSRPLTQLCLFPEEADLARIDATANCWRFYRLSLQEDLFGGTALIRHWGRIGTGGQMRVALYRDRGAAQCALDDLLGQKVKRGYRARKDSM
ncbi:MULTISPECIES: WGR domain-containing protein [unclassified Asaia]|uniref:WGR domain-containing protein n=1 Tax=unclassified Asaia TaxID=2685023 RepID=UPI003018ACF6